MKILVAEDEPKMARVLQAGLLAEGHQVDLVNNGFDALDRGTAGAYDVMVLDVMLPSLDGISVCRTLRDRSITTPILMLTARDGVPDRVRGLDAGADDYFVKPFAFAELLARLRALTRRTAETRPSRLEVDGVVLDAESREVTRSGRSIRLTTTEFALLRYLMEHPGHVLSRERLLDEVWGWDFHGSSNIVDVYIRYLRDKLGRDPEPSLIRTVRGMGYVFGAGR